MWHYLCRLAQLPRQRTVPDVQWQQRVRLQRAEVSLEFLHVLHDCRLRSPTGMWLGKAFFLFFIFSSFFFFFLLFLFSVFKCVFKVSHF